MKNILSLLLIVLSNVMNAQDIVRIAAHNSTERLSYLPMYMQQLFDTDLNKLLIYNGDRWVDTNGNEQ